MSSWRFKALTRNNRSRRSFTSKILHHFPLPSEYCLRNLNSVSSLSSAAFQSSSFCPMTKFVLWVNLLPPQAKNCYGKSSMGLLLLSKWNLFNYKIPVRSFSKISRVEVNGQSTEDVKIGRRLLDGVPAPCNQVMHLHAAHEEVYIH